MNKFYQTASNLYNLQNAPAALRTPQVPTMRVLTSGSNKPAQTDDDVRTIIGLALNRKQISN